MSSTTLVAVVGPGAATAVRGAAEAAGNVAAEVLEEVPDEPAAALEHLREGWRRARGRGFLYTLVDRDPLEPLMQAWSARLEGEDHHLELVIGLVGDLPMPDYYLVDAGLPAPDVHWYLGLLEGLRPNRIVPVGMSAPALLGALRSLRYGPELPEARPVAELARDYVPLPEVRAARGGAVSPGAGPR